MKKDDCPLLTDIKCASIKEIELLGGFFFVFCSSLVGILPLLSWQKSHRSVFENRLAVFHSSFDILRCHVGFFYVW